MEALETAALRWYRFHQQEHCREWECFGALQLAALHALWRAAGRFWWRDN